MSRSFKFNQSRGYERDFALLKSGMAVHPPARPVQVSSSSLANDLFAMGTEAMQGMARQQLSEEEAARNRRAAEADELRTEGHVHVNTRPQRHE